MFWKKGKESLNLNGTCCQRVLTFDIVNCKISQPMHFKSFDILPLCICMVAGTMSFNLHIIGFTKHE